MAVLIGGQGTGSSEARDFGARTDGVASGGEPKHFVIGYGPAGGAPVAPAIDAIADDTDVPGDFVTRDRSLTLAGSAAPLATLHIERDGEAIGTATADEHGAWSWDDPDMLALGYHSYFVRDGDLYAPGLVVTVVAPIGTPAGDGADVLGGSAASNGIDGKNGDDLLLGLGGNDTLKGGNGNDILDGGSENDAIWGGNGQDALYGRDGGDTLFGEAGDDQFSGGDGDDSIEGGAGIDLIAGGEGADVLHGGDGVDVLVGANGADRLWGEAGGDGVWLGAGDDVRDTVFGTVAHLAGDRIHEFTIGGKGVADADVIAVTGLASSYGKYLDSLVITDGVLSLSKVGGGTLLLEGLEGIHYTDTMQGSDGSVLMYVV